jgi:predicted nucleic acid-binding Zn ribbon protein
MRRRNTQPIGAVLGEVLKLQRLDTRLNEVRALNAWTDVLGAAIGKYTTEKYIKNGVLYVKLSSAPLRSELSMLREKLIRSLNENIGAETIKEIRFY